MKKSLRCFLSRLLALTLLGGPLLLASGCAKEEADSAGLHAAILVDAAPGLQIGETFQVMLPVSKTAVDVVTAPELVPMSRILDLKMAEAGDPELRMLCFVTYVDGQALKTLNRLSLRGQGRRLLLSINDTIVGVHPIEGPIQSGEIFFISEVPGETREARIALMEKYRQGAAEAILASRKTVERR